MSYPALRLKFRLPLSLPSHDEARRSDAELVQHCHAKDERAWTELVHRYERLVYSVPRNAGLNQTDSEDVMQSVFCSLFQNLPTLRDPSCLAAWLMKCAHNKTIDLIRRNRPTNVLAEELIESNDCLQRVEQQDLVLKAVGRLAGNEKIIITTLLENPDVSDADLAAKTGLKVGSVRMVKARGLWKLKKTLAELGWKS